MRRLRVGAGASCSFVACMHSAAVVDRSIGATHYTALTTVELCGKSVASLSSGLLADVLGYTRLFAIGATCSSSFVCFMWLVSSATGGNPTSPKARVK
jgi:hypothetical protein